MGEWQCAVGAGMSESLFADFFAGKRVLVTGHTGFKGGWLCAWLKLLGSDVAGFALAPHTEPNLFTAIRVGEGLTSIIGNLTDYSALSAAFKTYEPEIVIHNAAQALVRRSYRQPVETYATNVMGTVHLLEAARHTSSVRSVVIVTSDKCYENREWTRGYREEDCMGGHDPYSSSKGAAELVTAAYRRSFFHDDEGAGIASARAGNVIGGGDWSEDRLLPDIVRGITSGAPIIIRRPESVRPWQHVLEPLRGYLMLAQKLWSDRAKYAEAWNFGPAENDTVTVTDLAHCVVSRWKGALKIEPEIGAPHEGQYLRLDCAKASRQLGWRPVLSLNQALDWTVEWYRSYYNNPETAQSLTVRQIQQYMTAAEV